MPTTAGERDKRITFERAGIVQDEHGDDVEGWALLDKRWAQVLFGTGAERRTAAQTGASQPATFTVLADGLTRTITPRDRIVWSNAAWNITGIAEIGRAELAFTAVRAA